MRFIGVSNFSVHELGESAASLGEIQHRVNQILYNLFDRPIAENLLPYCQQHNITVMAYSPLARGTLTSKPLLRHKTAIEVLQQIARERDKSMAQVALNWCTSRPGVIAIPKSNGVERVEENCQASGWRLSAEQIETLDRAFQ